MRKNRKSNKLRNALLTWGSALAVIIIAAVLAQNKLNSRTNTAPVAATPSQTVTKAPQTKAKPVSVIIGNTGDMLIHGSIFEAAYKSSDSSYDFNDIFSYIGDYYKKTDYMVANLEVTLGGTDRAYSSYPLFNTPDSIIDALKNSGVDMLLTANNHCYDTGENGFHRTRKILEEKSIDYTGTRNENDKKYRVVEVGGIKLGMINYTYETENANGKALNGILLNDDCAELVNSFDYYKLDAFYKDIEENINDMYDDGAEAIIAYMHWGDEYHLEQNSWQTQIAQKLCDFGVDVIVGGHPHVIEPIDILESKVSGKQTVCIYSVGNALADQRRELMSTLKTGNTEDGVIFYTTFTRESSGAVRLTGIDATPTWTNRFSLGGVGKYRIVPLDKKISWGDAYSELGNIGEMENSYDRTMELLGDGLKQFKKEYKQADLRRK